MGEPWSRFGFGEDRRQPAVGKLVDTPDEEGKALAAAGGPSVQPNGNLVRRG
jgi:hypothetical protein